MKRICVFCGSSPGVRPEYAAAARGFGRALASRDIGLVYGGGRVGVMGEIADAVLKAGGEVNGREMSIRMPEPYRELQERVVNQLRAGSGRSPGASIVPMRSDYDSDPAMCLTSVAFLPDDMAQAIYRSVVQPLKAIEPDHHYYSPDSMHMTIKNVRTIHNPPLFTDDDVREVKRLFTELVPQHAAFAFSLEELVPFATSVSLVAYSDGALQNLVQSLDAGLKRIGVPDNKQYVSKDVFFGNLTLCRHTRRPSEEFYAAVEQMAQAYRGVVEVDVVHLITCNSVCDPETRRVLQSYELDGSTICRT